MWYIILTERKGNTMGWCEINSFSLKYYQKWTNTNTEVSLHV